VIVRTELTAHGGREIKHTGDGLMAAFTSVVASIEFAKDAQRRLEARNAESEHSIQISIVSVQVSQSPVRTMTLWHCSPDCSPTLRGSAAWGDQDLHGGPRAVCREDD